MGSYKDYPGLRGLAASGAYGTIPEDVYLRKIEQTNYYEDPDQVENHIRGLLVDYRPDAPFLASDEIRDPNDRGGGFHSEEQLNLRYGGARSTEEPYLPDGTFTDFEFLERDPRGVATGPDMRQHYEQQMARAAFIKFGNDEDFSVPETGINPVQMVANIKAGMYQFKDRYQNFEESADGWHNGGTAQTKYGGHSMGNTTLDGTILDIADRTVRNRSDALNKLSNDPTIAFRHSTTDHRFKIARYGMVRTNQGGKLQDWRNTQGSVFLDHAKMVPFNGELINKSLANLIVDLQGMRHTKQLVAQGAAYNDSLINQQASKKKLPDDVYKMTMIEGLQSQPNAPNVALEGKTVKRYGVKKSDNSVVVQNTILNHEIRDSMMQAAQRKKSSKESDLRESIATSAAFDGIYGESGNSSKNKQFKSENQNRNSKDTRFIEEQKETINYGGIKVQQRKQQPQDTEGFGGQSMTVAERKARNKGHALRNANDLEQEQDFGRLDFGMYDKADKVGRGDIRNKGRGTQNMMEFDEAAGEQVNDVDRVDLMGF